MTDIDDQVIEIRFAKMEYNYARLEADKKASEYRNKVREIISQWRATGKSIKQCATLIGITEGSLRELLRPEGQPRRYKEKSNDEKSN